MAQRPVVNANRARYSPLVRPAEFYPPSNNDYVDGEARFAAVIRQLCTRHVRLRCAKEHPHAGRSRWN
jgi:hypothetical protein